MSDDLAERVRTMPCLCSPRVGPGWVETRLAVLAAVRALEAEVAALRRVRDAATLKRNALLGDCACLKGRWVAVPEEDFGLLRAALEAARG